ncbi:MAG: AraC family transcriptional regulator, partial [Chthoniobacterales bacterium]
MKNPSPIKGSHTTEAARTRTCGDGKSYLFGKAVYLPGGRFGPWLQKDYQLVILISGSLRVTVDSVPYNLLPGEAILQSPGRRLFYRFSEKQESEHTWCEILPPLLSVEDKRLLKSVSGVHKVPSSIHLLIEEGLAVRSHESKDLHIAMSALARACLLRFAAHARSLDQRDTAAPLHPALERAMEIAASHYAELHSAEDLARRAGISATQLRTLYRGAKMESPTDMIWRLKVEHAIQLIRSTGLTLGEIAEHCGYSNPFHLSRSVRKHTGSSPRSLRQR